MYPRMFLENFWGNNLTNEVFVAMSFKPEFEKRWNRIIKPAVSEIEFSGDSLRAIRVDIRKRGDSILTEIMEGICHSNLIIADISVTDRWNEGNKKRCCKNGNVMYEVGLALACRQPVEVILIRDDDDNLLFDIAHIPVTKHNPENIEKSRNLLKKLILDRLHERNIECDLRVHKILECLSHDEIQMISEYSEEETISTQTDFDRKIRPFLHYKDSHKENKSFTEAVRHLILSTLAKVLPKLVEKGLLRRTDFKHDLYTWTMLGRVVADIIVRNKVTRPSFAHKGKYNRKGKLEKTKKKLGTTH